MTNYNAYISCENETKSLYIRNVGSMKNAKRHAKRFADALNLRASQKNWETTRTEYARDSGLHGGWESEARRTYTTPDGKEKTIKILRS